MAKFRKKPVVIEAEQVGLGRAETISSWMKSHGFTKFTWDGICYVIHTLEGNMKADRGDWIIRGVKGEFYPCKPDIFAATYEPVVEIPLTSDQVVEPRECKNCEGIGKIFSGHGEKPDKCPDCNGTGRKIP